MNELVKLVATVMRDKDIEEGHCDPDAGIASYLNTARAAIKVMEEPVVSAIRRNGLLGFRDMINEAMKEG